MHPAILVKVPIHRFNNVFIAMPFHEDFQNLKLSIKNAVQLAGYTPVHIGDTPDSPLFIQDFRTGIRAAQALIAVCSPMPESGQPNQNVIYELGFAQSIGKATVILTTDPQSIPSDLQGQRITPYNDLQLNSNEFEHMLANQLNQTLNRVNANGQGIIDTSYETSDSLEVVLPRHWIHLRPSLWDAFSQVIKYAKTVHHSVQKLESLHLTSLKRMADSILEGSKDPEDPKQYSDKTQFPASWSQYTYFYEQDVVHSIEQGGNTELISTAYHLLIEYLNNLPSSDEQNEMLKNLKLSLYFYEKIKLNFEKYQSIHSKANSLIDTPDQLQLWHDYHSGTQLAAQLNLLLSQGKLLSAQADSMIFNLVNIFVH